ncbi:CMP-N-acetylneuraminate-beta-galactosamide-alpha-2,3-sialyltransferase 2-like [Phyllostomus discolor]|uniref:beta-D-galactosyl-(1->3)-N-acetyl-beta-D-galactosaminide alpha-2,3-sialyltransferase n=1 Tax=Phyllostomus discolor TaxID=89673 RepID=A0A6J2MMW0_9CHIR|nr:CMP-N-acetylneuraminate-beta-galactosamide-alpha-2,3-sialyltransferase 2-like [Phyllostomus discolor]
MKAQYRRLSLTHKCSPCLHTAGDSAWFDRRFERAIEPLLSEESVSSDALMLWLGMKSGKEFEKQKQQPIKTSPSPSLGHRGSSCLTCAVVGNSRLLRGSGLGSAINQHDVVLRMNQAPVQGFEADVGNVTTVRIMYPDTASTRDPGAQLLLLPLNASGLDWFMRALENQDFIWKPRNPGCGGKGGLVGGDSGDPRETLAGYLGTPRAYVSIISLTFFKYVEERWLNLEPLDGNNYLPSLGFVALLYALHTCDQVSLFGFGTDNFLKWSHYWDDKYRFTSDVHSFTSESKIILYLQCEGKVAIYS